MRVRHRTRVADATEGRSEDRPVAEPELLHDFGGGRRIPWLAHVLNVSAVRAVELGMAPFLIGDALKLLVAGALLPRAWMLAQRQSPQRPRRAPR